MLLLVAAVAALAVLSTAVLFSSTMLNLLLLAVGGFVGAKPAITFAAGAAITIISAQYFCAGNSAFSLLYAMYL